MQTNLALVTSVYPSLIFFHCLITLPDVIRQGDNRRPMKYYFGKTDKVEDFDRACLIFRKGKQF